MTDHIDIRTEGSLGIITLDRAQAINALTSEMIETVDATLRGWVHNERVRAVLLEGRGPRGFCAGGDVRAVRTMVLAGDVAGAEAFFATEYRLNGLIATYSKPVVALTHGAVMGGGIGLAGHAAFRFSLPDVKFAMPESAIGFVVDTGVNAILAMAPIERALWFLLTGVAISAADALALGLTDCVIGAGRREAVMTGIILASDAENIETSLVALMEAESVDAGDAVLCAEADGLAAQLRLETAAEISAAVADHDAEAGQILASRSPFSLEAILQSHRAARRSGALDAILAIDERLARAMIARPDFVEGVRAVLVDKDQKPQWKPVALAAADVKLLKNIIENSSGMHDLS